MNLGDDLYKVWEIKTLKRKPNEEEARKFLHRIAKQVQPIMRKHKWRVQLLSEFCRLSDLGWNEGAGICVKLRLRSYERDQDFLPFEEVVDTMLHEQILLRIVVKITEKLQLHHLYLAMNQCVTVSMAHGNVQRALC